MDEIKKLTEELDDFFRLLKINSTKEIEGDDVYFEVTSDDGFILSVDVRGNLTEFYFRQFNFIIVSDGDYYQNVLNIVKQLINGNYSIIRERAFGNLLSARLLMHDKLEIILYKSVIRRLCKKIFPAKISSSKEEGISVFS